jgi:hypothetical protein
MVAPSALKCGIPVLVIALAAACAGPPQTVLEQLTEARRVAADLSLQFAKLADAGNRAVMADTDEASVAFAKEAEQATAAVDRDREVLASLLTSLGYKPEAEACRPTRFTEHRAIDRRVLALAVQNTNIKAQRLSFSEAQQAADAFQAALAAVAPARQPDRWQVKAIAAEAVSSVRQIQALQAPHIAEASDAVMTKIEHQMKGPEASAGSALHVLSGLCDPGSKPHLEAARDALDRFMAVNVRIVDLSRQNSNVQSLALALGQRRTLSAACEERLNALQDALAKRGFTATR